MKKGENRGNGRKSIKLFKILKNWRSLEMHDVHTRFYLVERKKQLF